MASDSREPDLPDSCSMLPLVWQSRLSRGLALNESKSCAAGRRADPELEVSACPGRRPGAACGLADTGIRTARFARNRSRELDLDKPAARRGGARHRRPEASCR